MPVTCESRYIGPDYPEVTCFSAADGDPRCEIECRAVDLEDFVDKIFDDARGSDGEVDQRRLIFNALAGVVNLQIVDPLGNGDTNG